MIITDFVGSPWIPILREAGRRVTQACAPENGYDILDCSKGYVHRAGENEPWAIRGLIHPAFKEPSFAEFHGSDEMLNFVEAWCGVKKEELVLTNMLLWCNPRKNENQLSWHRDVTWWGNRQGLLLPSAKCAGETPDDYSEEVERIRWKEIQERNERSIAQRGGVSMFLALTDDECHEMISRQPPSLADAV